MILDVRNIQTFYGESQALQGVTLHLDEGETVCILGRNGAGKSTTLKSIMGLTPPRSGEVIFDGRPIRLPGRGSVTCRRTGGSSPA